MTCCSSSLSPTGLGPPPRRAADSQHDLGTRIKAPAHDLSISKLYYIQQWWNNRRHCRRPRLFILQIEKQTMIRPLKRKVGSGKVGSARCHCAWPYNDESQLSGDSGGETRIGEA